MLGELRGLAAVAEGAARAAGAVIEAASGAVQVHHKGAVDLVTEVDLAAERAVCDALRAATPDLPILAEEGGGADGLSTRWIVDPLDGTTNFVHGFPCYGVSVALEIDGQVQVGCVYDAVNRRAYTATRGGGATCEGARLRVSETRSLAESLLVTGFPYDRREKAAYYVRFVQAFLERCQGIRRDGSAALDLCHIAAGRADGYWEFNLKAWDVAAGALLVEEAGGRVTDLALTPLSLAHPRVLASNGHIHEEMARIFPQLLSFP